MAAALQYRDRKMLVRNLVIVVVAALTRVACASVEVADTDRAASGASTPAAEQAPAVSPPEPSDSTPEPARATATPPAAAQPPSEATLPPPPPPTATPRPALPEGPDNADPVMYEGRRYWCERFSIGAAGCVADTGQTGQLSIFRPDIWCNATSCVEYDPDDYFEVTRTGGRYLCESGGFGSSGYDCFNYIGGTPPLTMAGPPELYCSGSESYPDCSELWYPNELAAADIRDIGGRPHVCRSALDFAASFGDIECSLYEGGDPDQVGFSSFSTVKCSPAGAGFDCATDYFPSEWEGLSVSTIDGRTHVCRDSYQGQECYQTFGSPSPDSIGYGLADFYCNYLGCSRDGYP